MLVYYPEHACFIFSSFYMVVSRFILQILRRMFSITVEKRRSNCLFGVCLCLWQLLNLWMKTLHCSITVIMLGLELSCSQVEQNKSSMALGNCQNFGYAHIYLHYLAKSNHVLVRPLVICFIFCFCFLFDLWNRHYIIKMFVFSIR